MFSKSHAVRLCERALQSTLLSCHPQNTPCWDHLIDSLMAAQPENRFFRLEPVAGISRAIRLPPAATAKPLSEPQSTICGFSTQQALQLYSIDSSAALLAGRPDHAQTAIGVPDPFPGNAAQYGQALEGSSRL